MEDVRTTSVVLADDHESVRRGIRGLLNKAPDIIVIGEARDGFGALRSVKELEPDVLLLDIEMPGLNGIEVTRRLQDAKDGMTKILVLSAYDDQEYIREVLANGASGYIIKGEAPKWIVEAVRGVARGEKGWVSPRVAQKIRAMKASNGEEVTLTFREIEVLRLIAQGRNQSDIAKEMGIEREVARQYNDTILKKLGAGSPEEAVAMAKREGWL